MATAIPTRINILRRVLIVNSDCIIWH